MRRACSLTLLCLFSAVAVNAAADKPIRLRNGLINPASASGKARTTDAAATDNATSGLFLIQFTDPVQPAWREQLRRNGVELLQYVPDDALMEVWNLPKQLPAIKDEGELSDIILENFQLLTCFNCGERLGDVKSDYRTGSEEAGVLCIEPGSINYPREPDEPTHAYFECMECRNMNDNTKAAGQAKKSAAGGIV